MTVPADPHIILVETTDDLRRVAAELARFERVPLDTEADSLHHYFEKVCLLQLTLGETDYLIDTLAEGLDMRPLIEALAGKQLIIHGADYDLRMMKRDHALNAASVFDTMLAAQLLGYERIGYAALVERHCGVVLNKGAQKSDWSQRPLPEELVTYAAADTRHLSVITANLETELAELGRAHWHREICDHLLTEVAAPPREVDTERVWRIKGWNTLKTSKALAYLRAVWGWRDQEAQRADKPAFKVLSNDALLALAKWGADGCPEQGMPRLPRNCLGRRHRDLIAAIASVDTLDPEDYPKPLKGLRRGLPAPDEELIAALKRQRDVYATELKIDSGVLLSGGVIQEIATVKPRDEAALRALNMLYNWQIELLGADLLAVVGGKRLPPPAAPAPAADKSAEGAEPSAGEEPAAE